MTLSQLISVAVIFSACVNLNNGNKVLLPNFMKCIHLNIEACLNGDSEFQEVLSFLSIGSLN